MMSSSTLMLILTVAVAAVPAAVWLCVRVYMVICMAVRCRRCRGRMSEAERTERCPLPAGMLREAEKAGRNLTWMLVAVLFLLVGLWLLGTNADQKIAVIGIGIGALSSGGLFIFSVLTHTAASMLPADGMACREKLLAALRKNSGRTGWMIAVYMLVHMLLTIG